MQSIRHVLGGAFASISRNTRSWSMHLLLPPVLRDLGRSLRDDREIVPTVAKAAQPHHHP